MKRTLLALAALSAPIALAQELEMWTLALSPTFDDYINASSTVLKPSTKA